MNWPAALKIMYRMLRNLDKKESLLDLENV